MHPQKPNFEELDFQRTHMGNLVLQRRTMLSLKGRDVYEVKLGNAYLMSSLFHDSEVALTTIGLGELNKCQQSGFSSTKHKYVPTLHLFSA